jgi:hypothetical protein
MIAPLFGGEYYRSIPDFLVEQNVCQDNGSRIFFVKSLNLGRYSPEPLIFYLLNFRMDVKFN